MHSRILNNSNSLTRMIEFEKVAKATSGVLKPTESPRTH